MRNIWRLFNANQIIEDLEILKIIIRSQQMYPTMRKLRIMVMSQLNLFADNFASVYSQHDNVVVQLDNEI